MEHPVTDLNEYRRRRQVEADLELAANEPAVREWWDYLRMVLGRRSGADGLPGPRPCDRQ